MIDLTKKTALILGGSRGIGAATAKQMAQQGARVAITYASSPDRASAVVNDIEKTGGEALAIHADALQRGANGEAVATTVERFGGIDILVSSAGVFDAGPIAEFDTDRFDKSVDLHIRSVFEAVQAALPHLAKGASIITVGSVLGDLASFPGMTLYTATKAAEAGLAQALAHDLGEQGITANAVLPGPIDTEMNPGNADANPMAETQASRTALKRYGKAEEVANLITFLASPAARYITGQAIRIDGGWSA